MIIQVFDIENYWKVIVFYDLDFNLSNNVKNKIKKAGINEDVIDKAFSMLKNNKAKAVTFNNTLKHVSIIVFKKHNTIGDYINSIVHEAEHVKQAMLEVYNIEDSGEPPAYTIGYLVSCMYRIFKNLLCNYT